MPTAVLNPTRSVIGVAVGAILAGAVLFSLLLGRRADLQWRNTLRVLLYFVVLIVAWSVVFAAASIAIAELLEYLARFVGWAVGKRWQPETSPYLVAGAIALIALAFAIALRIRWKVVRVNLLAIYHIADSLLNPHALRQFFVRLFDPGYYGEVAMDEVVDLGIRRKERAAHRHGGGKRLAHYAAQGDRSVHVALAVAGLSKEGEGWFRAWGIDDAALPTPDVAGRDGEYAPQPRANNHECWFVDGMRCPFSAEAVAEAGLPEATSRELVTIYQECGKLETHLPHRSKEA